MRGIAHPVDAQIEDLIFLDDTGVGAVEAARRTGFASAHALEKWLERQGRDDLWLSLKHRDPIGTHRSGNRGRRKHRLMAIDAHREAS